MRLISALRHENRNSASTMHDEQRPEQQRLGQVVDRQLDERRRPEDRGVDLHARQPRLHLSHRRLDTARSRRACWPTAASRRSASGPGPPLMTASPISGWWSIITSATSPRTSGVPSAPSVCRRAPGPGPRASGWPGVCWMLSRWLGVSIEPPVPMNPPLEKRSRPASSESAVTFITSSRVTLLACMPRRVDLHLEHLDALTPDRARWPRRARRAAGP